MINIDKKVWRPIVAMALLIVLDVALLAPEALKERMAIHDSSTFISNGAFFLSLFGNLSNFIESPLNWAMEYYRHYPGFSIRRYPPIFGLVEGVMYALFGISAVTAKLTILLFSVFWITGWFFAFRKLFKDDFVAFFSTLLILTLPASVTWGSSVRLDIPSMMFFAWGCYFYACYLDFPEKGCKYAILTSIMLVCTFYTYPLPLFAIGVLFLYMLISDRRFIFKKPFFHITTFLLFVAFTCPLIFYFIKTGLYTSSLVKVLGEFQPFIPVESQFSIEYWTFYLKVMWKESTVLMIGVILWALTKIRVRFQKHELFFLIWLLIGYIGLSIIPFKGSRYHLHFVVAAAPLVVIGTRDSLKLLLNNRISKKYIALCTSVTLFLMVLWNMSGISIKHEYVQGVDRVASWIVSQDKVENILYYGSFYNVFPFYIRKYDNDKKIRVSRLRAYKMPDNLSKATRVYSAELTNKLKTLRQLCPPEKIIDNIKKDEISVIVMESENLREGKRKGVYDLFYAIMKSIVRQEDSCKHLKDFPVLFGPPDRERQVLLRIYRVVNDEFVE